MYSGLIQSKLKSRSKRKGLRKAVLTSPSKAEKCVATSSGHKSACKTPFLPRIKGEIEHSTQETPFSNQTLAEITKEDLESHSKEQQIKNIIKHIKVAPRGYSVEEEYKIYELLNSFYKNTPNVPIKCFELKKKKNSYVNRSRPYFSKVTAFKKKRELKVFTAGDLNQCILKKQLVKCKG